MEYLSFLGRISVCFILGVIIGLERQYRRRIAGIRTITLVSLGAFLFVSVSKLTIANDISRVAAQVVSGIGFLGAGIILRDGKNIRGLNTAATLWCSAAVGTLTALGLLIEACIGVAFILFSNIVLRFISKLIMAKLHDKTEHYKLELECQTSKEMNIKNVLVQKLKAQHNSLENITTKKLEKSVLIEAQIEVANGVVDNIDGIINKLCVEDGVISVNYEKLRKYDDDDDDDYEVK